MLQTLGTAAELLLLMLLLVVVVEEGWSGAARGEARPRRGAIVGVEEDICAEADRGVGVCVEAKTGL